MTKPRLLDLFCGAGGAAMGYHRAGFEVVGVDIKPQPRYPFEFHEDDAMTYPLDGFDFIHASPPCQRYSSGTKQHGIAQIETHPDLVEPMRRRLAATSLPYIIENVPGAPLDGALLLCGTAFGLGVGRFELRRHRIFELFPRPLLLAPTCAHDRGKEAIGVYGHAGGQSARQGGRGPRGTTAEWGAAMDINWMTGHELAEAIPPAYTEWIGTQLLRAGVNDRAVA